MALEPLFSTEVVNAMADAATALADSGILKVYSGTKPATADTSVGEAVLLATHALDATAFGAATAGVCTAAAIGEEASIDADGTPSFFRVWKANGTDELWDGTVGESGCDLNFDSTDWQEGGTATITDFTFTANKAGPTS